MSDAVIESLLSPDRRLWIEFQKRDDGTYAFGVCQWFDKDPDNPYEREPGYWFPISGSGVYDTLETAKVEASAAFPQFFGGEQIVSDLTPLESAVLDRFRVLHPDLPALAGLSPSARENTGAGRFTHIPVATGVEGGPRTVHTLDELIAMEGVEPPGLGAVLFVEADELTLELHTFVGGWDGVERAWKWGAA